MYHGPESKAAYFTSVLPACTRCLPRRDLNLCVCEEQRVCRVLGSQVVCGVGVREHVFVFVLGCGLYFVVLLFLPYRRDETFAHSS